MKLKAKSYSLALETSCDDTAVAIVEHRSATNHRVIAEARATQYKTHAAFGGVVPSLAARDHAVNAPRLLKIVWQKAQQKIPGLAPQKIKHIAYTAGPGLAPCLLIGRTVAETLAWYWRRPLLRVDHIAAHVASALMNPELKGRGYKLPAVALVASGGHTSLFKVASYTKLKLLGRTLDDAAGEAFDKVGRLLGLAHPAGPALEKLARRGNPKAFNFPRPIMNEPSFNFSFAGLKTSVFYKVRDIKNAKPRTVSRSDSSAWAGVAASFQQAVIDVLIEKTARAAQKYRAKSVIVAGGVAANQALQRAFQKTIKKLTPSPQLIIPPKSLCTDNAVMIGVAGALPKALRRG